MSNKIILSYDIIGYINSFLPRPVHPIIKTSCLKGLIEVYDYWNDSEDETYISFCFFATRKIYMYNLMAITKKVFIKDASEYREDKWDNGKELLFINNKTLL
jgi:hypothetical protein